MIKFQLNEAENFPTWDPTYTEVVSSRASKAEMIMLIGILDYTVSQSHISLSVLSISKRLIFEPKSYSSPSFNKSKFEAKSNLTMNSRLLLLLLLRVGMGFSAPLDKSKTQPSLRLFKETQINRPLGAAEPIQGSVAIETDLPDSGNDCSGLDLGVVAIGVCSGN